MDPRDEQLQALWLALCTNPTRDDLAVELADAFLRELDEALAALAAATTDEARAAAIGGCLRAALDSQWMRDPRDPFLPWTLGDRAREVSDDARPVLLELAAILGEFPS